MRVAANLLCVLLVVATARADERGASTVQRSWTTRSGDHPRSIGRIDRNFGPASLPAVSATRADSARLLNRTGGWGYGAPWGYYYPYAWGYYRPGGGYYGHRGWYGWGARPGYAGPWGYGFGGYRGRYGWGAAQPLVAYRSLPLQHDDGWYVGPEGLARDVDDRDPPRGASPQPTYEGCFYW